MLKRQNSGLSEGFSLYSKSQKTGITLETQTITDGGTTVVDENGNDDKVEATRGGIHINFTHW